MNKLLMVLIMGLLTTNAQAGKFYVTAGAMHNTADSNVSMGVPILGAKLNVDAESDLSLEETSFSPYIKFVYELDNKHSFYADWRTLHRDTKVSLNSKPVSFLGNTYQANAEVNLKLNLDIARIGYGYNFYETENLRLDALVGLHIMNINAEGGIGASFSIDGVAFPEYKKTTGKKTTAPLPNIGMSARYELIPGLSLTSHVQAFMISTHTFDGFLTDFNLGAEYQITKSLAVNASYNHYQIDVSYGDSLLNANLGLQFSGPMLSLTYQF